MWGWCQKTNFVFLQPSFMDLLHCFGSCSPNFHPASSEFQLVYIFTLLVKYFRYCRLMNKHMHIRILPLLIFLSTLQVAVLFTSTLSWSCDNYTYSCGLMQMVFTKYQQPAKILYTEGTSWRVKDIPVSCKVIWQRNTNELGYTSDKIIKAGIQKQVQLL